MLRTRWKRKGTREKVHKNKYVEITGCRKIRKGIETKIFVGSEILKMHAKLIDSTTRNVRSRESGKRPGPRI